MNDRSCYVQASWLDNRAVCECGHIGKRRLFRSSAELDAVLHCQQPAHLLDDWLDSTSDLVFA
ncbi:hypothetical protein A5757_21405 [Mycobacterium sp. 852013-51886_SCH5428379]|uniref:hypothetical protein n=1 Tax=Mycobacterium sp. 852013-51886_SCH5428379 TaxID=1834111 RepID=UPI0007FFCA80|nr:hypothetical protein [Mycobacterium sp. 852013-51886_SCH5428379]OBB57176.1 hypothetical protein A5757_21405 [Mycobacterium sp. 852013-51886_SCH5428379]